MALEAPLWLQGGTYSARLDRMFIDLVFSEGVIDLAEGALLVSERALGVNRSVDVAAGICIITGDDQADQGKYICRSTAVENVALAANTSGLTRVDRIVAQVRDPNAGGTAGTDWTVTVVEGTAGAGAPATPASAISLATVSVANGATTIADADITDTRTAYGLNSDVSLNGREINQQDNLLIRSILKDYAEEVATNAASGATPTVNLESGNVHDVTLTANATFTFSNPIASGDCSAFTLILRQDATGSRAVTWPASVDWAGGTPPTLTTTASGVDILTFLTVDGGATWFGFVGGKAFA